jgi:hypothetical protein
VKTSSAVVLTGVTVATGRWAKDQKIGIQPVIALGFVGLVLAALSASNDVFASQMATLILVAAVLTYGLPIARKLNIK